MAFPTTSVIDNFNRTENPLSTGWAGPLFVSDGQLNAGGATVTSTTPSSANAESYRNGGTFGADSEVFATIGNVASGDDYTLFARITSPGTGSLSGYGLRYIAATGTLQIRRIDAGSYAAPIATASITLASGDKIGLEIIGTTLKSYYYTGGAWTNASTVTDSTYSSAGYIGAGLNDTGGTPNLDDFGGGTVVTGGGGGSRPMFRGS